MKIHRRKRDKKITSASIQRGEIIFRIKLNDLEFVFLFKFKKGFFSYSGKIIILWVPLGLFLHSHKKTTIRLIFFTLFLIRDV